MRLTYIVVATLAVLAVAAPAPGADFRLLDMDVEGEFEAGIRSYIDRPSQSRRGKLEEYRDIPSGAFLNRLQLRLLSVDSPYSTEFGGSKWGQDDQEFALTTGRLGLWQFGFEWDQTPHVYSTTARFLATETRRGVYVLPNGIQNAASLPLHNSAPEREISVRWDTARLFLALTPTPDWDIRTQYTRIFKDGDRPFSVNFGSPGGTFYEVPGPIDQTIHDFRVRGTLMRENWQIQAGYTFSAFQNALKSVFAENPAVTVNTVAATSAGLVSLEPDNLAHTFNIQGAISLPLRSRLSANVAYSMRMQNESFLAHTINPAIIATDATGALVLPRRSLDGLVGTTTFNLNFTSRPIRPLTVSVRYRLFDHDSMSEEPVFPGHVVSDQGAIVVEDRRAHGFEYTRHNADVDTRWQLFSAAAVTVGAGWERWRRNEHREVPESDEFTGKLALDVTPLDWVVARVAYRPSFRRISTYRTFAHLEHTVVEDVDDIARLGQSRFLRKFDEGERDRQKIEGSLQLTPLESVGITLSGEWRNDEYLGGHFGVRDAEGWSAGIDLSWNPAERFGVSGGYTHERITQFQRSRSRPVVGTNALDFTAFDWTSEIADTIDTIYAGFSFGLIPKVLDWTASASWAYALGRVDNRNPVSPATAAAQGATAAQITTATVQPFPAFEDTFIRLDTALRYHFLKAWTASLGYVFESFQKNDWRTDRLNPFIPGAGNNIWLGNDYRNYTAHIVGVSLGYRFGK
jgi:MtrB/PioB family decaheme-associated outer membrane protein